jgi:hypothetical protein
MCDKCEAVKAVIREYIDKEGHDRCWYYPDIFNRLAVLLDIKTGSRKLPTREEFEAGCKRYQDEQFAHQIPMSRIPLVGSSMKEIEPDFSKY